MQTLKEIQDQANKMIINQKEAVKVLSTLIYKHYIKLYGRDYGCFFNAPFSLLLHGDTGCGKTYLVKTICEICNLNFIEINCKSICQEGWMGRSFLSLVLDALNEQGKPKGGIILLDEFDKLLIKNYSSRGHNENANLQTTLLKYVEGMKTDKIEFNNFIFLFAGSFEGLDLEESKPIGFVSNKLKSIPLTKALIKYGLLPELAGRINNYCKINSLSYDDYSQLLELDCFQLNLWIQMLKKLDITVPMNDKIKKQLISEADKLKLGARGLIQTVEQYITEILNENIDKIDLEKYSPLYTQSRNLL